MKNALLFSSKAAILLSPHGHRLKDHFALLGFDPVIGCRPSRPSIHCKLFKANLIIVFVRSSKEKWPRRSPLRRCSPPIAKAG